jgi:hemolysin activation/secretion protein
MPNFPLRAAAAAATLLLTAPGLRAQSAPDAGQLLRDANRPPATAPTALPEPPKPQVAGGPAGGPQVQVQGFKLSGVTLLNEAEVQARLAPFTGKPAGMADLRRAADAVAELYRERGYLVRAYLPEQTLQGGVVAITVLEGRLGGLRVEHAPPALRIGEAQVRNTMTARQKLGEPVRADDIQRAISLLNAMPGISASSLLEPGEQPGESRLVVSVKDEALVTGQVQIDNAGSKASGEWRASGGVSFNSPSGRGDQVQLYASKSSGSNFGSAAYSLPLGSDGLRGTLNGSRLNYGYSLSGSRYSGAATVLGASLSYPVLRSQAANLNLSAGHDRKAFDNAVAGIQLNDKKIQVSSLGLAGDAADTFYGGGLTQFGLTLTLGRLDLAGNATDLAADQAGPQRQGSYRKLGWSLGRLQRITAADTLALSWSGQRANRNLDSAEKFGATGQGGVRAYSSAEPSADNGQLFSVEWRHQIGDQLTLAAYHERARVQRDHSEGPGTLSPNRFTLAGSGVGISWGRANELMLRAALAWRQGDNPARNPATGADSDGTHRNPRAYISLLKIF